MSTATLTHLLVVVMSLAHEEPWSIPPGLREAHASSGERHKRTKKQELTFSECLLCQP